MTIGIKFYSVVTRMIPVWVNQSNTCVHQSRAKVRYISYFKEAYWLLVATHISFRHGMNVARQKSISFAVAQIFSPKVGTNPGETSLLLVNQFGPLTTDWDPRKSCRSSAGRRPSFMLVGDLSQKPCDRNSGGDNDLNRGPQGQPRGWHRSPKRPKTVLSGGRLREMTWWSQTNFFRDHLYHCYGFYLDRLDTPSSFSLISENQLIFCFSAIFDTKFSRYHRFEGTSSLSSVFVQLNSGSIMKKL